MMKALKGVSARLLFKEFPILKKKLWGGHLEILPILSQRLVDIQSHKFGNTFKIRK